MLDLAEEVTGKLISLLIQRYGKPFEGCVPTCRNEIEKACRFMEQHFSEHIYLDQICRQTNLSKSTLLRAFTKSKGVTPIQLSGKYPDWRGKETFGTRGTAD
jgi:AraC-like DNA-binding protein